MISILLGVLLVILFCLRAYVIERTTSFGALVLENSAKLESSQLQEAKETISQTNYELKKIQSVVDEQVISVNLELRRQSKGSEKSRDCKTANTFVTRWFAMPGLALISNPGQQARLQNLGTEAHDDQQSWEASYLERVTTTNNPEKRARRVAALRCRKVSRLTTTGNPGNEATWSPRFNTLALVFR